MEFKLNKILIRLQSLHNLQAKCLYKGYRITQCIVHVFLIARCCYSMFIVYLNVLNHLYR